MPWVRDELEPSADMEVIDKGEAQISYLWYDGELDPVSLASDPTAFLGGLNGSEPLPAHNSQHPLNRNLILDRYSVQKNGATQRIVGLYSSDRRFRFPDPPEAQDPELIEYSSTKEDVRVSIPYPVFKTQVQGLPPNFVGPPQEVQTYGIRYLTYIETRRIKRYQVLLKRDEVELAEKRAGQQRDNLHIINEQWMRFTDGDVLSTGRSDEWKYSIEYNWHEDLGSDIPDSQISLPGHAVSFPVPTTGYIPNATTDWIRPPFHEFHVPETDDATVEPDYFLYCPYYFDANGWTELIGLVR